MSLRDQLEANAAKYKRGWSSGRPETECGSGSMMSNTTGQRAWIPGLIEGYAIKSISDIGAGDLGWVKCMYPAIDIRGPAYQAYDLVPRHPLVKKFNIIKDVPPRTDMIMCLWVLNHLSEEAADKAMQNIRASGSPLLLMTWKENHYKALDLPYIERLDLPEGGFISLCRISGASRSGDAS